MKSEEYAVVIPFYDGLATIQKLVAGIEKVFDELLLTFQIIIVDDSANDKKHDSLQSFFSANENVSLIKLDKNFGQHYATFEGLKQSSGSTVITMDEDLQHNPKDISVLIKEGLGGGCDIVYGNRLRKDWRYWLGRGILAFCFPNGPKTTCSFRLIKPSSVEELVSSKVPYFELEGLIYQLKPIYAYADVKLGNTERDSRKSSYSFLNVYTLISNLIAFYSWLPIVWIAMICFLIQLVLIATVEVASIFFLPISAFSLLTLIAYFSTRVNNPDS